MRGRNNAADVIVIGAGLAGLTAAAEAADAGRTVIIIEQESEANLGGQAFWSLGGLFLVDSPEQRRLGICDSIDLALQDWAGSAGFDRPEDNWPRQWAKAYVEFAATEKRAWLTQQGMRFYPIVNWAERGGALASGHGNSVPRFHIARGSGPGVLEPIIDRVKVAVDKGLIRFCFRHKVIELSVTDNTVTAVRGNILAPSQAERGIPTSREISGDFELQAQAIIIAAGGIGGNHDLVRQYWPTRMGNAPKHMISGVPDYVDGSMLTISANAGANLINLDRMWHYPEGLHNYAPIWSNHAIRILSGPSPLWLNAQGERLPNPLFPGCDTLSALREICLTGSDYSWLLLNQTILAKEFALSGSEQNPDLASKSILGPLRRMLPGATNPVQKFVEAKIDFVVEKDLAALVHGMNRLTGNNKLAFADVQRMVKDRDRQISCKLGKDAQIMLTRSARHYFGDRLLRVVEPHELLDSKHGPLIAARTSILTRKTLGGLETDLSARVLQKNGSPLKGLYAAGEITGFGGGGLHGYRALEGTFLGGCLFSGRTAGRAAAKDSA